MRERDLIGRDQLFIAEGSVVLERLAASKRFATVSILIDERRLGALTPVLERFDAGVPIYIAPLGVLDQIVGFHIHRGVLAIGSRGPDPDPEALIAELPASACVVMLVGLSNADNVGGVFRNCAAFGADVVLLDPTCCDPLYRKAIRVSVGGALITPFARVADVTAMLAHLRAAGFELIAMSPTGGELLGGLTRAARTCVILGAEGPGLPPAVLSQARGVQIPMAAGFDSLNVATTSGIVLHELMAS